MRMEEEMQNYRVFYTDVQLPGATGQPDLSTVIPLEFATREEAMKEAFKLIFHGAVVWKIDGPDGFHIERAEIERQYWLFRVT